MGWPGWAYLALLVLAIAGLWAIPRWQIRGFAGDEKDRRILVNEYRRTIGQLVAGLAFVGTIYATSRQLAATHEQLELNRQGQVSDRFRLAAAQLGDSNPHVAVAAIFGLEGVSKADTTYRDQVLYTLSAYLQTRYRRDPGKKIGSDADLAHGPERDAVAAVLRRWTSAPADSFAMRALDLSNVDLIALDLHGARLRGAVFQGADLRRARLDHADLRDAKLSDARMDHADLSSARLDGADVNEARMCWVKVDSGTSFHGAMARGIRYAEGTVRLLDLVKRTRHQKGYRYGIDSTLVGDGVSRIVYGKLWNLRDSKSVVDTVADPVGDRLLRDITRYGRSEPVSDQQASTFLELRFMSWMCPKD